MDPFIGSEPDLINNRIMKELENQLNIPHTSLNSNIFKGVGSFYNNLIEPNMFPIIIITLLFIYLTIKYVIKRDNDEKNINNSEADSDSLENIQMTNLEKTNNLISHKKKQVYDNQMDDLSHHISDDYLLTDSD